MCLAVPGKVLSVSPANDAALGTAIVSFGGITREVSTALVPETRPGDYVLVHVGVAIALVDEHEAMLTFDYLQKLGELDELSSTENQKPI